MFAFFINRQEPGINMAKGKDDLILRDRLQFTLSGGNLAIVYGRIDLSDYVSVVNNEGLKIKECRFQLRNPSGNVSNMPLNLGTSGTAGESSIQLLGTTTAYESGADMGIASPNVFAVSEQRCFNSATDMTIYDWTDWGVPDLHPEGYTVVSDVLIGVCADSVSNTSITDATLELDVMLIAEPVKVTKDELKDMLAQATDL